MPWTFRLFCQTVWPGRGPSIPQNERLRPRVVRPDSTSPTRFGLEAERAAKTACSRVSNGRLLAGVFVNHIAPAKARPEGSRDRRSASGCDADERRLRPDRATKEQGTETINTGSRRTVGSTRRHWARRGEPSSSPSRHQQLAQAECFAGRHSMWAATSSPNCGDPARRKAT